MTAHTAAVRADVLRLLRDASELEHSLCCSYLFAASSLKSDLDEGGLDAEELMLVRKWAAQIRFIAGQEMLHLAQVCNLRVALGSVPHLGRPPFPQPCKYYPLGLALGLEPFSVAALKRFVCFERPTTENRYDHFCFEAAGVGHEDALRLSLDVSGSRSYRTVGELYGEIRGLLRSAPSEGLFIGSLGEQLGPGRAIFPELIQVSDRATAVAAIDLIVGEGEGTPNDLVDCHFGVFVGVLKEFECVLERERSHFAPVRPVISNPRTADCPTQAPTEGCITHPTTRLVALAYNAIYNVMMSMLGRLFAPSGETSEDLDVLAETAIACMTAALHPLGAQLTRLPVNEDDQSPRAGPPFELDGDLTPTVARAIAWTLMAERLEYAQYLCGAAAESPGVSRVLTGVAMTLADLNRRIDKIARRRPTA